MRIVDLSHHLANGMPLYPGIPDPSFTDIANVETDGYAMSTYQLINHIGTHVDAPAHQIAGGDTLDEIPLERLVTDAVVVDVSGNGGGPLSVAEVERHLAKIGSSAARRYFVTGETFDARTALRIGLVHEVARDLDAALDRVLAEVLSAGPKAARAAKRLVLQRPDGPETARWIAERRTSDEGQEGLRAFLERRRPGWAGLPD